MTERTLVLLKPDAVRRKLIGEIISRFEKKRFDIVALRILTFDEELVNKHYEEHIRKEFFPRLKKFIMSGPTVAAVIEGDDAINSVRKMVGATDPRDASPGTIRGDLATEMPQNLVHASDSPARAQKELALFFPELQKEK